MTASPLVSVLMPVYNGELYVAQAIESILAQTFTHFELLITDDGSKDNSLAVLKRYASVDTRIRLTSRSNRGLTPTLNEMLWKAQGELIAIMEQDDISLPCRLDLEVSYFQTHPEVVCISGAQEIIDAAGRFLTCLKPPTGNHHIQALALAGHSSLAHPGAMFRKQPVLDLDGYDESLHLAHDLDLWLRLGEIGSLANIPEAVIQYRIHPRSESGQYPLQQREQAYQVCQRAWERRGIEGQFEASHSWRPGRDQHSKLKFTLKYGWWAFNSSQRQTAIIYALKAIQLVPYHVGGWNLLRCAVFKSFQPLHQP